MQNKAKRILAMLMMVCLLIGLLPMGALATESSGSVWFTGQQLSLGDDLDMKYYVFIDGAYTQSTVMNITVGSSTESYDIGKMTADENGYYEFTVRLAAAQMTDEIKLSLVEGEKEIASRTYSVQNYAKVLLEENYDVSVKTMVKAMLNYGAKAQTYFGYNADNLANAGYEMDNVSVPEDDLAVQVKGAVSGICFYGASLVYTSKVAIRYYFTADSVAGLTFKVGETSYNATEKNGMHYVEVPGINPQDYDAVINLTVSNGADSLTVGYSPLHYITRMYHKNSSSETCKALLGAMYTYYQAACDYVEDDSAVIDTYIATEDLYIRDPFVLTENGTYYLYGTRGFGQFEVFTSTDLKTWKAHKPCFVGADDFWGNASASVEGAEAAYWAPEVHKYNDAYYMIATFTQSGTTNQQASVILKADSPMGPFQVWSEGAITPAGHSCLDATLYVENGTPYLIYAHEWQCSCKNYSGTGTMDYIQLSADLKTTVGTSSQWFGADELTSFWEELFGTRASNVTDGPFVYTDEAGQKYLLWATSMDTDSGRKYSALATRFDVVGSDVNLKNDTIKLYTEDGGHSMIFTDLNGIETLVLHTPNSGDTRAKFFNVLLRDGSLVLTDRNNDLVISGFESYNADEINNGKVVYTGSQEAALELNAYVGADTDVYMETVLTKGAEFNMSDLRYGFLLGNVNFNLISNQEGVSLQMTDWNFFENYILSEEQVAAFEGDGLKIAAARVDGVYYMYVDNNGQMVCAAKKEDSENARTSFNLKLNTWPNAKGAEYTGLKWTVGVNVLPDAVESANLAWDGYDCYDISALNTGTVIYTGDYAQSLTLNAWVGAESDAYIETVLKKGADFNMSDLRYGFLLSDIHFNLVSNADGVCLQITDWNFYENYTLNEAQVAAFEGDGLRIAAARVDGVYKLYAESNGEMVCVASKEVAEKANAEFNLKLNTWPNAKGAEYQEILWKIGDFKILKQLSGQYVSILGDSISTYQGVSNVGTTNTTVDGYNAWYNGDWQNLLGSSDDTYWGKVMSKYNMNLLVNNSCGGNKLTEAGGAGVTAPAGYVRVENLAANTGSLNGTTPDKILIFMGTNDYIGGVAVETFAQAYVTTLEKAAELYPDAQVFVFTLIPSHYNTDWELLAAYNAKIRELAEQYAVVLVDVAADSGITTENYWYYTYDGTHPNKLGISVIAEVLEQAILSNMVAEEPEAADTYNMNFEDAELGNYLVQDGSGLWMDQYDKGWSWVDADAETGNKYLVLSGAEGDATVDFWFNGVTAGSTVEFDFRMPVVSGGWDRLAVALGSSDVNYSWCFEQWQGWTSVKYPDWDGNTQTVSDAFAIDTWYSVKMEWSGDGISVKLWERGTEEPAESALITWNSAFAAGSDVRFNFVTNAQSYLHLDNIRIYKEA